MSPVPETLYSLITDSLQCLLGREPEEFHLGQVSVQDSEAVLWRQAAPAGEQLQSDLDTSAQLYENIPRLPGNYIPVASLPVCLPVLYD